MDTYRTTVLRRELDVRGVITVHYFEFARDYLFKIGRAHV